MDNFILKDVDPNILYYQELQLTFKNSKYLGKLKSLKVQINYLLQNPEEIDIMKQDEIDNINDIISKCIISKSNEDIKFAGRKV